MKNYLRKTGKLIILDLLVFSLVVPGWASSNDIKKAEQEIEDIQEDKEEIESMLDNLNQLKNDTEVYVRKLDQELNQIYNRLEDINAQMEEKQAEINTTIEELEIAKADEQRQYESMKLRIQYMYEKGNTSYIDLLLSAGSGSELLSRAEYISQISEYDRNMLVVYQETKDTIAGKEIRLEEEHAKLAILQEETKQKQSSVETLISAKTKELEKYDSEIQVAESQIEQYQKDIEAQENQIKKVEAEIKKREEAEAAARKAAEAAGQSSNSSGGSSSATATGFIWPCPSSKRITSEFGSREAPVAGASSYHQGIDIGTSTGSNIIAAASGEVVISTYSYSSGNYVMISHGDGISTVYMHCSKLLVSVGDYVQQGDVIALVGSTGYSTGPHLHFGVRVNGVYVNPRNYVS